MDNGLEKPKKKPCSPINGQPVPDPGPGRPKGLQNKATTQFKEALNNLLETSAPQMIEWLGEIKEPEKRFDVITKLAEYIHPKLARSEVDHKSTDGSMRPSAIEIIHVKAKDAEA
jgi:hypothetical protein